MNPTLGSVIGKSLGVFGIIGFGLGIGTVLFLAATGVFAEGGVGGLVAASFVLLGVLVFAALVGIVVAALTGWYAGRELAERPGAFVAGAVGGAGGHAVMVVTLVLVLAAGMAMLIPIDSESGGGAGSSGSTGSDTIDISAIGRLILEVIPAGLVGGVTAYLLHVPPPQTSAAEAARPAQALVMVKRPQA